jgi:hypothetical protein
LLASLLGGVLSTFVIVKTTDVKEQHWEEARRLSDEAIAGANAEAAKANAKTAEIYATFSARRLTPDQQGKLTESLRQAGFKIRLRYESDDEVIGLQNKLALPLIQSGALDSFEVADEITPWVAGILIGDSDLASARSLQQILRDCCGLQSSVVKLEQIPRRHPPMPLNLMTPEQRLKEITETKPPDGVILMYLARKPVPEPPEPELPDWVRRQLAPK